MTKTDLVRRILEECGSHEHHRSSGRPCRVTRSPAAGGGLASASPCSATPRRAALRDPQTGARVRSKHRRRPRLRAA